MENRFIDFMLLMVIPNEWDEQFIHPLTFLLLFFI